ncbi:MAG: hypothetical protein KGZ85_09080 [Ignavibacterium sp.]|nr:hypothetical protein [Ignavibacterium sp.]
MIYLRLSFFVLLLLIGCSSKKDLLPEEFFGLILQKKLTGVEAKKFVDELHFQEVAPDQNEIGFYSSPIGSSIIYITYYRDEITALTEYEKMINKISPENSVFINPEIANISGKDIYRCFGMGQSHYVFAYGKELYWISVDTHFGKKFIEEYLEYIN